MRKKKQLLVLVAEVAVAGLKDSALSPDDCADFYDGLGVLLPFTESEAAKYAATCIRESHRAQQDFRTRLDMKKGAA
jgi:hypothetical protein